MAESQKTTAVVLAAGRSSRLGSSKALVRIGDETAVERIQRMCCDAGLDVHVVLGFAADLIQSQSNLQQATVCFNSSPERGQASSVVTGIQGLSGDVCLFPVDHAFLQERTLTLLLERFRTRENGIEIVVPVFRESRGHPIFVSQKVCRELLAQGPDEPAHTVVRRSPKRVLEVPVDDVAVHKDFDTPEDLAELKDIDRG